ncbi:type I-E CRISPR-associated protein Cse1/CasA [Streptomyces sp. SL54]|uniref:Type I-E CRISPR-associated protein Cse1/CasA n=1 Tax=Streptantibioticus silvisoli TaxID=2705255 RepID=A0ABT6W2E4_9ACTN|nr:type I-E CRISPR-associated protein Cse1/CasA [Streptantibioticus silvisoli]MDI5964917.1 type I-E CRISPR-associated protein Cse1/CasA [Streptantibioticus silvisoli]
MSFNLIDEPWQDVRPVDGGPALSVGLRDAILRAHEFADLVVELPTQKPALLRQVLLPVVVDALRDVVDAEVWARVMSAGRFEGDAADRIGRYLDEHRELFDLFHPVDPFAQVAGLRTAKDETKGAALLVATASSGNNVPLFATRTEGDPLRLSPAQAARWLLHTHCWDTAAIKTGVVGDPQAKAGKTTGNPTGPLGQFATVTPGGRNLFDTLMLNVPTGHTLLSDDLPQWRRRAISGRVDETLSVATPEWRTRAPRGYLDLWTWQSRRIRLVPEETGTGMSVSRVLIAAGDRMNRTPDFEPHTSWRTEATGRTKKSTGVTTERPRRLQPGVAAWRGMEALLETDRRDRTVGTRTDGLRPSTLLRQLRTDKQLPDGYSLRVELTGIAYGTQSAVIDDVMADAIPLPVAALQPGQVRGALLEAADQADTLARAVNTLSADIRRAAGAEPIPWDKGQRPGEILLHALDPLVRRLLSDLRPLGDDFEAVEERMLLWENAAREQALMAADTVAAAAPPGTFNGRTIRKDGKDRTFRQAGAEKSFRSCLKGTLTRAAEAAEAARAERAEAAETTDEPVPEAV